MSPKMPKPLSKPPSLTDKAVAKLPAPPTPARSTLKSDAPKGEDLIPKRRSKVVEAGGDQYDICELGYLNTEDMQGERQRLGADVGYFAAQRVELRTAIQNLKIAQKRRAKELEVLEAEVRNVFLENERKMSRKPTVDETRSVVAGNPKVAAFEQATLDMEQQIIDLEHEYEMLGATIDALKSKQAALVSASMDQYAERRTMLG